LQRGVEKIGVVIGRELPVGAPGSDEELAGSIAGFVLTNDVSARDIQLTKGQSYESKSYPTFTPVGPVLVLCTAEEIGRFSELRLRLQVNRQTRQNMLAADTIFKPLQALRALTAFQRLDPGDLLLTGTPVGTAVTAPSKPVQFLGGLLPERIKWRAFLARQQKNPKYLSAGRRHHRGHGGRRRRGDRPRAAAHGRPVDPLLLTISIAAD
jgi:2-keto-4-pentenoate hydratase/2-oxohepta-3-ene-1,7-dioic acid hydratase in catechol pathway